MREIKFRYIWKIKDKFHTQIISIDELDMEHDDLNGKLISRDEWTGLKDKQGREIYEGDVVKGDTKFGRISVVMWNKGEAGFTFVFKDGIEMKHDYPDEWYDDYDKAMFKVIGNIYENPELLK